MAVADDLARSRSALQMINPAPYNAEAPPAALVDEITPTELHYVRSNFAVPAHDGTLEVGGAVGEPITLTLDDLKAMPAHERAVTLECAGNGRQHPTGSHVAAGDRNRSRHRSVVCGGRRFRSCREWPSAGNHSGGSK